MVGLLIGPASHTLDHTHSLGSRGWDRIKKVELFTGPALYALLGLTASEARPGCRSVRRLGGQESADVLGNLVVSCQCACNSARGATSCPAHSSSRVVIMPLCGVVCRLIDMGGLPFYVVAIYTSSLAFVSSKAL